MLLLLLKVIFSRGCKRGRKGFLLVWFVDSSDFSSSADLYAFDDDDDNDDGNSISCSCFSQIERSCETHLGPLLKMTSAELNFER